MTNFNLESKICTICRDDIDEQLYVELNCGHKFHQSCITKWSSFAPGDFLDWVKIKCPDCREGDVPIVLVYFNGKPASETLDLNFLFLENIVYRLCQRCSEIFEAGPNNSRSVRDTFPAICEHCCRSAIS